MKSAPGEEEDRASEMGCPDGAFVGRVVHTTSHSSAPSPEECPSTYKITTIAIYIYMWLTPRDCIISVREERRGSISR